MLIGSSALQITNVITSHSIFSQPTTISLSLFELLTCDALMHVVEFSFDMTGCYCFVAKVKDPMGVGHR